MLPIPTLSDVIETYTARGMLGTVLIRKLASSDALLPASIEDYLAALVRCDELNLIPEASATDLDLQDELATAAGMPRIGAMFVRLSLQVRLFITIFGLNYRYPTGEILRDDRRIVAELYRRAPEDAVEAWRQKIDNAAAHMLSHLRIMV